MGRRQTELILAAVAISLPSCLLAQTTSQHMAEDVRVPFVGCASDGQAGPLAAPKGTDKLVQIYAKAAQQLAYHQAEIFQGNEDLIGVYMRLPPALNDLTSPIIKQIERDNPIAVSSK